MIACCIFFPFLFQWYILWRVCLLCSLLTRRYSGCTLTWLVLFGMKRRRVQQDLAYQLWSSGCSKTLLSSYLSEFCLSGESKVQGDKLIYKEKIIRWELRSEIFNGLLLDFVESSGCCSVCRLPIAGSHVLVKFEICVICRVNSSVEFALVAKLCWQ